MINNWLDKVGYYDIEASVAPVFKDNAQSIAYDGSNITLGGSGADLQFTTWRGIWFFPQTAVRQTRTISILECMRLGRRDFRKKITVKANK